MGFAATQQGETTMTRFLGFGQELSSSYVESRPEGKFKRNKSVHLLAFCSLAAAISSSQILYIIENRFFPFLDIDESGYLARAVQLSFTLKNAGFLEYVLSCFHGPSFAPLLPTLGSVILFLGGAPNHPLIINAVVYGLLAISTFIFVQLKGTWASAWFSGIAILATPQIIDFSRSFNFALAVTFFGSLAILAMTLSRGFTNFPWSLIFGASLSLMCLSRTMALAFLPGFIIAALLTLGPKKHWDARSKRNIGISLGVGLGIGSIWYVPNLAGVASYLLPYAYGDQSSEYGNRPPIWNPQAWLNLAADIQNKVLFMPEFLLLAFIAIYFLISALKKKVIIFSSLAKSFLYTEFFGLLIVSFWIFVVLLTTKNAGSGFSLILVPLIVAMVARAISKLNKPGLNILSISLVVLLLAANLGFKQNFDLDGRVITIKLETIGDVVVMDPRGEFVRYYQAAYESGQKGKSSLGDQAAWQDAVARTFSVIKDVGADCRTSFGFRHNLLNVNSLELYSGLTQESNFNARMINPQIEEQSKTFYVDWINSSDKNNECLVLTASGEAGEFSPAPQTKNLEAALIESNYDVYEVELLPDGRVVKFWTKANK